TFGVPQAKTRGVSKVSKDSFNSLFMGFFRISLIASTHAHTKHYIGPRSGKVKKTTNHGAIKLLVCGFTLQIGFNLPIGSHWGFDFLAILYAEALEEVMNILLLMYEYAILHLLDLKTKEHG